MLLKKNRADKKVVELVLKKGKFVSSPHLTFKFITSTNSSVPRISFIVPKNVAKLAVKRNFLKRLGYTILQKYIDKFPTLAGVFVFKKYQDDVLIIENEIKNIRNKIN